MDKVEGGHDYRKLEGFLHEPTTQRAILDVLEKAPGPMRLPEIMAAIGKNKYITHKALLRLRNKGFVLVERSPGTVKRPNNHNPAPVMHAYVYLINEEML